MKFTVAFFKLKRRKDKKINKYVDKYSYINSKDSISIKKYEIVLILFVACLMVINCNDLLCFTSNISKIENIEISKENIIALNAMADTKNYVFTQKEENTPQKDDSTQEEIAMDMIASNYSDTTVFNTIDSKDIQVVAETNNYQKLKVCGVDITNYSTNRNIDFAKILNSENKEFSRKSDTVFMYTTHTSESYANSQMYSFEYTSPRRTTDGQYNMLSVASIFASNLNKKGINTICSLTPHDYGEYNSAYTNSRRTFESIVLQNPDVAISIDVHRDAIEDLDFAPKAELSGYNVASLMLVMGIGYSDGYNPYYEQNLKLALEIQILANKIYPGLFRPMIIRNSIYNQDIKENSFLVEVGASGNTLDEAKLATRCLANLLNILYRD